MVWQNSELTSLSGELKMIHGRRLIFCLLLSIALLGLFLPVGKSRGAQDDCQDCLSTCQEQRLLCVENGNPPAACLAAWKECADYCDQTFCP